MFVSNVSKAQPFLAADLSEIRLLVDRANTGIASVSLAAQRRRRGDRLASTERHRRDLFHSLWPRSRLGGRRIPGGGAGR